MSTIRVHLVLLLNFPALIEICDCASRNRPNYFATISHFKVFIIRLFYSLWRQRVASRYCRGSPGSTGLGAKCQSTGAPLPRATLRNPRSGGCWSHSCACPITCSPRHLTSHLSLTHIQALLFDHIGLFPSVCFSVSRATSLGSKTTRQSSISSYTSRIRTETHKLISLDPSLISWCRCFGFDNSFLPRLFSLTHLSRHLPINYSNISPLYLIYSYLCVLRSLKRRIITKHNAKF